MSGRYPDYLGGEYHVQCDRCGGIVHGFAAANATGGFYFVRHDNPREVPWMNVFQEDEHFLCDFCVQTDPKYQGAYPGIKPSEQPQQLLGYDRMLLILTGCTTEDGARAALAAHEEQRHDADRDARHEA